MKILQYVQLISNKRQVIHVDVDRRAFERNPTNGLFIPKWDGDDKDSTLYDLASLLRAIAVNQVRIQINI